MAQERLPLWEGYINTKYNKGEFFNGINESMSKSFADDLVKALNAKPIFTEQATRISESSTISIPLKREMANYCMANIVSESNESEEREYYNALLSGRLFHPLNEAIEFVTSGYPGCDINIESATDRFQYLLRVSVKESGSTTLNGFPINKAIQAMHYENSILQLQNFASDKYFTEAVAHPRKTIRYANALREFMTKYNSVGASSEVGYTTPHIQFEAGQIQYYIQKASENMRKINECMSLFNEGMSKPHATYTQPMHEFYDIFADHRMYTNLSPQEYFDMMPQIKAIYLKMVDMIKTGTTVANGFYYPGWDSIDWADTPEQYFDRKFREVTTVEFGGKQYGQLRIPVCEIDPKMLANPKLAIKEVKSKLSAIIPDELQLEKNDKDTVALGLIDFENKASGMKQLILITNAFAWKRK